MREYILSQYQKNEQTLPARLVRIGDFESMRRFLLMAGDGESQDNARNSLFETGATGTVCTPQDGVKNIQLMAWPVAIRFSESEKVQSTIELSDQSGYLVQRIHDLWLGMLVPQDGLLVYPLNVLTSLYTVLNATPLLVRDCVRHGIQTIENEQPPVDWSFEAKKSRPLQGSPNLPLVYLLTAYVCWDVGSKAPSVGCNAVVQWTAKHLMEALISSPTGSLIEATVGEPVIFHEAMTQGQGMQIAEMLKRYQTHNWHLGNQASADDMQTQLNVTYLQPHDHSPLTVFTWTYSSLWRPASHIEQISLYVDQALKQINQSPHAQQNVPEIISKKTHFFH